MLLTIGLLSVAVAVLFTRWGKIINETPTRPRWTKSGFLMISAAMTSLVLGITGVAMMAKFFTNFADQSFGVIDWAAIAAVVVGTVLIWRWLSRIPRAPVEAAPLASADTKKP